MPETSSTLEPVYSEAEREELGHMAYLIGRLDDLCERQLIAPAARATLAAENEDRRRQIERSGQYQAAIEMAKSLVAKQPRESLAWAARAQEIDPSRTEAWKLLIDVNWALGNDDDAMARCAQAAEHLPEFRTRIAELEEARTQRALARRLAAEHARQQAEVKERLVRIKSAVQEGRDDEVITLGKEILAIEPDHIDALITTAFAQQRSDRLDEALGSYETLQRLQPSQPRWAEWSRNVQRRREIKRLGGTASNSAPPGPAAQGPASARALFEPPTISWTSFAGAFLQAHAQELLLGLAVLLIVVSSTVGAHMLLGDLLWSPIGKCILALVATFLFAGFGMGLLSWGASRAGRMMLIATLIVVPIHFMLVGEMNLLHSPTTARYLFLVIEGVALVSMVRWVSAMLAPPAGARLLTAALLLISLGSVATARGSPTAWGVQFAAFQMSPLVFLAAVWTVGARRWGETSEIQRDFSYLTFGLLGFALVACLIRTGAYALRLDAALYALPVMLIGVSAIHAVRQLRADEPDAQRLAIMRPGGYGLSGLAFALSLAGPPAESAVHSGNIFAVACVGLVLYATALREGSASGVSLSGDRRDCRRTDRCPLRFGTAAPSRRRGGPHISSLSRPSSDFLSGDPSDRARSGSRRSGHLLCSELEGSATGDSLPVHRTGSCDRGVCGQRIRAAGRDDLPFHLRDLVLARHLDFCRTACHLPCRHGNHRSVLFRPVAGTWRHAGRPRARGGLARLHILDGPGSAPPSRRVAGLSSSLAPRWARHGCHSPRRGIGAPVAGRHRNAHRRRRVFDHHDARLRAQS